MTFRDLAAVLRRRLAWLLVTFAVVMAAGLGLVVTATPTYTATVSLVALYQPGTGSELSTTEMSSAARLAESQVRTYAELARSAEVVERADASLGAAASAASLPDSIETRIPDGTSVLEISVTETDAGLAADAANALAQALASYVAELQRTDVAGIVTVSVVTPATPPVSPSSPRVAVDLAVTVVIGAVLALLVAFARDELDTRVRTADEAAAATGLAALGAVPVSADLRNRIAVYEAPAGSAAEEVRRAAASLEVSLPAGQEGQARCYVLTSVLPAEGKTTVCLSLAAAYAEDGARVLVMEADLRRPSIASKLGIEGAVGLTQVLAGRVGLEDAVQRYRDLDLLLAGAQPANPTVLLGSAAMSTLLTQVAESGRYDYILIDTPPLEVSAEAALLARLADALVMVCQAGRVRSQHLSKAVASLEAMKTSPLGFVFNGDRAKARTYGAYGYGYGDRSTSSRRTWWGRRPSTRRRRVFGRRVAR